MKTYIYLVRHGEVYNPKKIWYGRLPFHGLSIKGREQIEETAQHLKNKHIDVIYSSPLLRARQSAQIIRKKLNLPKVHFSKNLLEVKSSLQGSPDSFLLSINYDFYASKEKKITGETIEEISSRMSKFIRGVVQAHKGKHIAAVSHGDPIGIVKIKEEDLTLTIDSLRKDGGTPISLGGVYCLKI